MTPIGLVLEFEVGMRWVFKAVLSQKPCVTKDRFQIGVPVQWGKHCNLLAVAGWYFQSHA